MKHNIQQFESKMTKKSSKVPTLFSALQIEQIKREVTVIEEEKSFTLIIILFLWKRKDSDEKNVDDVIKILMQITCFTLTLSSFIYG